MNLILSCEMQTIPPSVNHYWGVRAVKGIVQQYLTKEAKSFRQLVALYVKNKPTDKRLMIDVEFCFTDRRRRDIDNYLKALLDALVKAGLCVDDEQFDVIQVKRGEVVKGGLTKVKVYEL